MKPTLTCAARLARSLLALGLCGTGFASLALAVPTPEGEKFRVGFSHELFAQVNENDARASMGAFSTILARERGVPADPEHGLYDGVISTAAALRRREADAIGVTTAELWILQREFTFTDFLFDLADDGIHDQYLLIVRRDSGLTQLSDLRGKAYTTVTSARMTLATVWLDLLLADQELPPTKTFLGPAVLSTKPNKAVLPLFFGQMDVSLISRRMFTTLIELNPQIANKVDVLAISPMVVPFVLAYHSEVAPEIREATLPEMARLHLSPAGRQILTILQCRQVVPGPPEALASTFHLLNEHARRCPDASAELEARLELQPKHRVFTR